MKNKLLMGALLAGCVFSASADGYTDGIDYYKAGQYTNARTVLTKTLNDASTDKALANYYLGQVCLQSGETDQAKKYFDAGIAVNAENPYNYVGLGAIELINGNAKAADDYFKTALKYGKKNNEVTVDIARAYYNAPDGAVKYATQIEKYLAKAHKDSKNQEPSIYIFEGDRLFDEANTLMKNGDKDAASDKLGKAAAQYEQAITWEQDNPEGYVKYASAYMGVNPQFGINKLEELLSKQPNSALAQRELAENYYEANQWTKAASQYEAYMNNPNHFPEDEGRYMILVYATNDYPKSVAIADDILSKNPSEKQALQAYRVKMRSLNEMKDYSAAKAAGEKMMALQNVEFNPSDYSTFGLVQFEDKDTIGAIQSLEKAIALDPTKIENYKSLSSMLTNAGQYTKAAEVYQSAVDAQGDDVSATDLYQLAGRWFNAAAEIQKTNPAGASEDAAKGLDAINKMFAMGVVVQPPYLDRKAKLQYFKDQLKVTPDVASAFEELVTLIEADPESMQQYKNMYRTAVQTLLQYNNEAGNTSVAEQLKAKLDAMNNAQ